MVTFNELFGDQLSDEVKQKIVGAFEGLNAQSTSDQIGLALNTSVSNSEDGTQVTTIKSMLEQQNITLQIEDVEDKSITMSATFARSKKTGQQNNASAVSAEEDEEMNNIETIALSEIKTIVATEAEKFKPAPGPVSPPPPPASPTTNATSTISQPTVITPSGSFDKLNDDEKKAAIRAAFDQAKDEMQKFLLKQPELSLNAVTLLLESVDSRDKTVSIRIKAELEKKPAKAGEPSTKQTVDIKLTRTLKGPANAQYVEWKCESSITLEWKVQCELIARNAFNLGVDSKDPDAKAILVAIAPPEDLKTPRTKVEITFLNGTKQSADLTQKEAEMIQAHATAGYERVGIMVNNKMEIFASAAPTVTQQPLPDAALPKPDAVATLLREDKKQPSSTATTQTSEESNSPRPSQ